MPRILAERGPHPGVSRRGRIALVEHEVDDLEDRWKPGASLFTAWKLERYEGVGERPLCAHDSLSDRWLGHKEGSRDLVGGQAAQRSEGERGSRLSRQDGMTRREDEAQEIVADVVVDPRLEILRGPRILDHPPKFLVFPILALESPKLVDRPTLCGRHEPSAGIVRRTLGGPVLERRHQRVLGELLGEPDVAHHSR
jgi:hypothetical protein